MSTVAHLNRYFIPLECRVPAGAKVMELKYCEVCGKCFARPLSATEVYAVELRQVYSSVMGVGEKTAELRKDHGERFCSGCRGAALLPDIAAQEKYKALLPGTRRQLGRSTGLPKFDNSLIAPLAYLNPYQDENGSWQEPQRAAL